MLAERFGADVDDLDWEPRYNIAPTQQVPALRRDDDGVILAPAL
jgi:putative SOS response-associated peptidase YedK